MLKKVVRLVVKMNKRIEKLKKNGKLIHKRIVFYGVLKYLLKEIFELYPELTIKVIKFFTSTDTVLLEETKKKVKTSKYARIFPSTLSDFALLRTLTNYNVNLCEF